MKNYIISDNKNSSCKLHKQVGQTQCIEATQDLLAQVGITSLLRQACPQTPQTGNKNKSKSTESSSRGKETLSHLE
jgi:hypothetical protein